MPRSLSMAICGAEGRAGVGTFLTYLAGSIAALILTSATLVFLASGEVYHRAFQAEGRPSDRLIRAGDLLSAVGVGACWALTWASLVGGLG